MELIDKSAVVAEIEKKKIPFKRDFEDGNYPTYLCALMDFEDFINSLEVKEVDLKKEFSQWWKSGKAKDYNVDILYERYSNVSMKLAKHFFELGLKAQKGE